MRSSVALPPIKRAQLRYASSNKETPALSRTKLVQPKYKSTLNKVIAAYTLNYLKLQVLKLTLIGIVLYNAIKEYYNDRIRKIIYFYSYTIETIYANYIKNSRSNVTMLDNYYNNNINNILIKYIDNKQQQYNTLIEDYNYAEKREDNILTIDECRTSYSNKEDIEANKRETRVRLRELLEEIYNILLREFRRANNFTESIIHNDDEQNKFTILAEKYIIDNYIIYALLEDCDALVKRYKEEINCSNLYSTM
ncbi:hypothetical protein HBH98_169610 [Parastagonospora nodorum]|nr:hypothetical protein HBH98_169610 [Parastagonospora nodorum]KAH4354974.1 hypothetical protein HBH97_242110 [Parastagonospora nodorum]KAH4389303.1 hypothetical protein HBH99_164430 [Parastagonospora nodorum]